MIRSKLTNQISDQRAPGELMDLNLKLVKSSSFIKLIYNFEWFEFRIHNVNERNSIASAEFALDL